MSLIYDFRLAVRTLTRRPTFVFAATITLALGIGANTAVFSVVDGILWRPLEYAEADQLVALWPNHGMNTREIMYLREYGGDTFESVAFVAGWTLALSGIENPTQIYGARTSANVFATLGTPAHVGRAFVPEDGVAGAAPVVVLSHQLWSTRFGGDSTVVGNSLTIDGARHEVIGVMGPDFELLNPTQQLWIPLRIDESHWTYTANISQGIARLGPQVTVTQAGQRFEQLLSRFRETYGLPDNYGQSATVTTLKSHLVGGYRLILWVLLGAVGLILLIAGSNLSNLMLVKASGHRVDIALRSALGATRRRLAQSVMAEALVLALFGGAIGLLLAYGGVEILQRLVPDETPRVGNVSVDGRVLAVCFLASVGTGILFSVMPAVVMTRIDLQRDVAKFRMVGVTRYRRSVFRNGWVTVQIAMAVMLVVGASLMIQTIRGLMAVDPGFDDEHVLTLRVQPAGAAYDTPVEYRTFYQRLNEQLEALPGVLSAGGVQHLPLSGWEWGVPFEFIDAPVPEGQSKPVAAWRIIVGDYLETLRIPILEGRTFSSTDRVDTEQVALVNRSFSERFLSGRSPIGQQLILGSQGDVTVTVVGVVNDIHHEALDEAPAPEIYRPLSQSTMPAIMMAVRVTSDPEGLSRSVQETIWEIDPDIPVSHVMSLRSIVRQTLGQTRLVVTLLTSFAVVALVLGAVGVYGVTSFAVNRRANEIGIRKALGASNRRVRSQVLRQGMSSALLGTVIGLGGAAFLGRFLQGLVFQIRPTDPLTFVFVSVLILVVAGIACMIPAWRATRIDPARALRNA